jgi:SAM-dependent methyltransferase
MNEMAQPRDWRDAWRTLSNLLPPAAIVAHTSLGTDDPAWEQQHNASNPDRLVLYALALEEELRAAFPRAGIRPGMRVLDAACGPGIVSRLLVEAGAREVVGVDIDPAMLKLAQWFPMPPGARRRLSFRETDLTRPLPFLDAAFDAVWLGDAWFPDRPEVLAEIARVTRPGGSLIVKIGGVGASRTYAWDRDSRLRGAHPTRSAALTGRPALDGADGPARRGHPLQ